MKIATPYYIVDERKLLERIELIERISRESGCEFIIAFKAFALWRTFGIYRSRAIKSTASSLNEMWLANEELGCRTHTYCPAYTPTTIDDFIKGSSHITFNSVEQFDRFSNRIESHNASHHDSPVSSGLRINPMCSVIDTGIYDPCSPGSRFGVTADCLEELPQGIEGFHFHALCESTSHDLEKVLDAVESQFGSWLPRLKWLNMGGGHLVSHKDYDTTHLIALLRDFKQRHPNLHIILEPGSAWAWQTGNLEATVVDVVRNSGIMTAIVDVSFACHMPDCLEMPYKPVISQALPEVDKSKPTYRMGGNSCLSGDFVGDWSFEKELKAGDRITFEDMIHYTTVKTNMFNGISHPAIVMRKIDGSMKILKQFGYQDYKDRMD